MRRKILISTQSTTSGSVPSSGTAPCRARPSLFTHSSTSSRFARSWSDAYLSARGACPTAARTISSSARNDAGALARAKPSCRTACSTAARSSANNGVEAGSSSYGRSPSTRVISSFSSTAFLKASFFATWSATQLGSVDSSCFLVVPYILSSHSRVGRFSSGASFESRGGGAFSMSCVMRARASPASTMAAIL